MLKITQLDRPGSRAVVRLEGKLLAPWVDEVQTQLSNVPGPALPSLDLADLTYADQAGTAFLQHLLRQGIEIESCSPFLAELLHCNRPLSSE